MKKTLIYSVVFALALTASIGLAVQRGADSALLKRLQAVGLVEKPVMERRTPTMRDCLICGYAKGHAAGCASGAFLKEAKKLAEEAAQKSAPANPPSAGQVYSITKVGE